MSAGAKLLARSGRAVGRAATRASAGSAAGDDVHRKPSKPASPLLGGTEVADLGESSSWYVQGGPAIVSLDGEEAARDLRYTAGEGWS